MNKEELRRYWQPEAEVDLNDYQKRERIPASLVDISQGDIVLISEKRIMPGTEVEITMDHIDDFAIHGTIKLVLLINKEGKFQYRHGIETDQILGPEDILESIPAKTIQ
jgi:hypothetical protein